MVTSQEIIRAIRKIIDKHYNRLTISALGNTVFSKEELEELKKQGLDITNKKSFLDIVYNHNFINRAGDQTAPTSSEDMEAQQSVAGVKPEGEAHDYTVDALNNNARQLIEKLKNDVTTKIEGIIRENNDNYKFNALQNLDRPEESDNLVKESSLGKVKQKLRDLSGDASRDWQRVALTEMSNAIGVGSVDRIVTENRDKDLNDVYVFRVIVGDAKTCKYCRRFYQDSDNAPKVYRMSTLLGNGSNYGKKTDQWSPVIGATHPNTRTSQIIELKPGWKVLPGGRLTYIGMEKWKDYILDKLSE